MPRAWQYTSASTILRTTTAASASLYLLFSTMRSNSSPPRHDLHHHVEQLGGSQTPAAAARCWRGPPAAASGEALLSHREAEAAGSKGVDLEQTSERERREACLPACLPALVLTCSRMATSCFSASSSSLSSLAFSNDLDGPLATILAAHRALHGGEAPAASRGEGSDGSRLKWTQR
jgi:hypothetical protein